MQGFILNVNKVKDEDLIVTILSRESLEALYRFYGARHGAINLGFKIDYEKEDSYRSTISRLRDVIHIGFKWINDYRLLRVWQDFCALFYRHLKDTHELDPFYFDLLESASSKWGVQNPKRVAIESYVALLKHEGRLHKEAVCYLCSLPIEGEISLIRAFLPTHKECSHTFGVKQESLLELFENDSTLFLDDEEIERLWYLLLEGL